MNAKCRCGVMMFDDCTARTCRENATLCPCGELPASLCTCGPVDDSEVENPKEAVGRTKLPLHLCPPAAKREMARGLNHGANVKGYGEWNWRAAGIFLMTYIGALQRHLDAIHAGEDIDPESGVSHIGHILAGAAIVADAAEHLMLTDDRPPRQHADIDRSPHPWWKNL